VRGRLGLERRAPPGQRWGCERAPQTQLVGRDITGISGGGRHGRAEEGADPLL
jgi:hypothetical protein